MRANKTEVQEFGKFCLQPLRDMGVQEEVCSGFFIFLWKRMVMLGTNKWILLEYNHIVLIAWKKAD